MREVRTAVEEAEDDLIAAEEGVCVSAAAPRPFRPSLAEVGRLVGRGFRDWAPAAVVFVLGIAAWEGLVRGLGVERFLLPPLSDILQTL